MEEALTTAHAQELAEVAGFLRGALPFQALSETQLQLAVTQLCVSYHPQSTKFRQGEAHDGLRIIRSGAIDVCDSDGTLLDRLGEGESFHIDGLNAGAKSVVATVIEDALIYRLPDAVYRSLRTQNRGFDRFFTSQRSRRLRRAARLPQQPQAVLTPVSTVMSRDLLTVPATLSVQELGQLMSQRRVSSALVTDGDVLLGIVTDRDLRSRVVATALDRSAEVGSIMTRNPHSIGPDDSLFAATLRMTEKGHHHLPVLRKGKPIGMVTTSDLILARRDDPVYLVQHIHRQNSVAGIRALVEGRGELMQSCIDSGLRVEQVARVLTAIADAACRRLIRLAEAELGPAPAPWAWLSFGSQARGEQLLGADQDNGMVIDDAVADDDLGWYRQLAQRVCDGLAECGYSYCGGGIMASTDAWRVPLQTWRDTVRRWTRTPTAEAVMRVGIFFDIRSLHGDHSLAERLQAEMLEQAERNTIFQAAMAAGVLDTRPPLGLFRRFVVERDGAHRDGVDLKKRGILPLTEIARLHALAHGIASVNTAERLRMMVSAGHMGLADSRNLIDALHCIQQLRMQHQGEQLSAGAAVDNYIEPRRLPRLAREQLRDAFTIIDEAQTAVRQTYRAGMG